jgi:hypothetical protein
VAKHRSAHLTIRRPQPDQRQFDERQINPAMIMAGLFFYRKIRGRQLERI